MHWNDTFSAIKGRRSPLKNNFKNIEMNIFSITNIFGVFLVLIHAITGKLKYNDRRFQLYLIQFKQE